MAPPRQAEALHVVLLAGGSGTRFWPLSRGRRPKQFLPLAGDRPLVQATWRRVRSLAPPRRIWVVAPAALADDVRAILPGLRADRLIVEPAPRDTGPAVALAAATVARHDPAAITAIFPTDHVVRDERRLGAAVRVAAASAARGSLVCFGVRPDRPATGYGYLRFATRPATGRSSAVERFVEKPDAATARRFLRSGRYLWNAGMFVWQARRFLQELETTSPRMARAVTRHLDGDPRAWARAPRLSVDYAVMEKAADVRAVPLEVGWDDVGSWDAACRLREAAGREDRETVLVDSAGSVVFGDGRMVAIVDLPDIVVVDTPDALLVLPRRSSQKVRAIVDELTRRRRRDLL